MNSPTIIQSTTQAIAPDIFSFRTETMLPTLEWNLELRVAKAKKDKLCNTARGPHGASHPEWAFRREAIIWLGNIPIRPNIVPFAAEMSLWTQQKITALPLLTKFTAELTCQPKNPYTYSLGAISLALGNTINDAAEFSESTMTIDPVNAEVTRIRYESELIIYAARFCEAAIKQMLYCTQFPTKMYEKASMGQLLARGCESCAKAEKEGHDISLLGALAHRFFLCQMLDGCAFDHLQIVARRRNLEAAHSESQSINPRTAAESRSDLAKSLGEIGHELGHMTDHIGKIEEKMIAETELFIRSYPAVPPMDELMRISIRWPGQYYPDLVKRRGSSIPEGNQS